jgi:hypothetical protein
MADPRASNRWFWAIKVPQFMRAAMTVDRRTTYFPSLLIGQTMAISLLVYLLFHGQDELI